MRNTYKRLGLAACVLVALFALSGCHKAKHREMRVHEEQREGPVQETPPGEMVVE